MKTFNLFIFLSISIFFLCQKTVTEPEKYLAAPTLISPSKDEIISTLNPKLKWQAVRNASQYEVLIDDSTDFVHPVFQDTLENVVECVSDSLEYKRYYWKVRAVNGEWSEVWNFTIEKTVLDSPVLRSPPIGMILEAETPLLQWQPVDNATEYEVLVDNSEDFSAPEFSLIVTDLTECTTDTLKSDLYYWKVRATDGEWSDVWNFQIETRLDSIRYANNAVILDDENYRYPNQIIETFDGGFVIIGLVNSENIFVIKLDPLGNQIWKRVFTDYRYDNFSSILELANNNLIFHANRIRTQDNLIVTLDPHGNLLNENMIAIDSVKVGVRSLIQDREGNIVLTGYTERSDTTLFPWMDDPIPIKDLLFVKLDQYGNMLDEKIYFSRNNVEAFIIVETNDGGYAILGQSYMAYSDDPDWQSRLMVVKVTNAGEIEWDYVDALIIHDSEMVALSNGNIIIAGHVSVEASYSGSRVVVLNNAGNLIHNNTFMTEWGNSGLIMSFCPLSDDRLMLAGRSYNSNTREPFLIFVDYDLSAMQYNLISYDIGSSIYMKSLIKTSTNKLAMVGTANFYYFSKQSDFIVFLKTDIDGAMIDNE